MLSSFGMANAHTTCEALAHNCQVTDAMLRPEVFDKVCDLVFYTNTSYRRRPLQLMPANYPIPSLWHRPQANVLGDGLLLIGARGFSIILKVGIPRHL